jgi:mannosyltransferase OCH1-like enzyme
MQVSQIYFSDSAAPLPEYLADCVKQVKHLFPQFAHQLYNLESAREFLAQKFGKEIVGAFDKLNPYAYKADLLKYCILYQVGGWYFDVPSRPLLWIEVPDSVETIAFRDIQLYTGTNFACQNSILFAKPQLAIFERAIKLVVENCKKSYYGINALCPTGPVVLGKAFATEDESQNRVFGDYTLLTPLHNLKNRAFVLPDGAIFAFGKNAEGGDLTALGAVGTNNYNHFYNSRTVYK